LREALQLIRDRGYSLSANDTASRQLRQAAIGPATRDRDGSHAPAIRELVGQLTRDEIQLAGSGEADLRAVVQIAAPVFAPDATVAFQLVLSGLPSALTQRKLERYVERLLAAAAAVTNQINGRVPASGAARA
jgi:DNA-binding IclR family transcriptional regulator